MYRIVYAESVATDLATLRARERARILNSIEAQLTHEPTRQTRNRKRIIGLVPPWEHEEPVWQLRVGDHHVFYDDDEAASVVTVRAIRHKPPHKTTEEIL
jgi:mRNA-degrading endonuclease RelE of RelBE toxin-antitoxin system